LKKVKYNLLLICPIFLTACAPTFITSLTLSLPFRAAFSSEGVVWVNGGKACVARAPSYRQVCPELPEKAVDVAWNNSQAWAVLPYAGFIVTLDRAALTMQVGRAVAMTATRIYREDGSAVSFQGNKLKGVVGSPTAALTGGDNEDYVLLAGKLKRVSDDVILDYKPSTYLRYTPFGIATAATPGITTKNATYRLTGTTLEKIDLAQRIISSMPHGPGHIGIVGTEIVTISPAGDIRVFNMNLTPKLHRS
jgi:hypothetical protein